MTQLSIRDWLDAPPSREILRIVRERLQGYHLRQDSRTWRRFRRAVARAGDSGELSIATLDAIDLVPPSPEYMRSSEWSMYSNWVWRVAEGSRQCKVLMRIWRRLTGYQEPRATRQEAPPASPPAPANARRARPAARPRPRQGTPRG